MDDDWLLTGAGQLSIASYVYGKRSDLQKKMVGTHTTGYDYDNLEDLHTVVLPDGTMIEYIINGQNIRVGKK